MDFQKLLGNKPLLYAIIGGIVVVFALFITIGVIASSNNSFVSFFFSLPLLSFTSTFSSSVLFSFSFSAGIPELLRRLTQI